MKHRKLPKADLSISELGFGCMSLGDDLQENGRLLHHAFEAGINYFDTADIYQNGFNEETVGRALKPVRSQVVIATKVGNEPKPNGEGWKWNSSKSYILSAVEKSLKRLQTDYIDLYQLHGGTFEDPWEETVEAFEQLKEEGKIRHYGISSIRPNVIRRFATQTNAVNDMLQYSLLDRRPEEEVLSVLKENGLGVMVRGSLAKGILVNKRLSNYLNYTTQDIDLLIDKMNSFSIEKMSLAQLAIKWVLSRSEVSTVVVGIRKLHQLEDILGTESAPDLSNDQVYQLSQVLKPNRYTQHR